MSWSPPVGLHVECADHCDNFYTSGTLRCLLDPMEVFEAGRKIGATHFVVARNWFPTLKSSACSDRGSSDNGRGPVPEGCTDRVITYPHRPINEDAVHVIAEKPASNAWGRNKQAEL